MNHILFSGTCTALVTPFLANQINYPMMDRLIHRQIDSGIPAVVVCGTTGESPTLSDAEKLEIIRRSKHITKDRCLLIAGTGSNNTCHTVQLSKAAEEAGADALLVVSPYYNKPTPDGLIAHFTAVANSVSIPVILYNVPSRTGIDMPVNVYQALSALPNIAGVKEASADICKITRIRQHCGSQFGIWTGNDDMTVPAISLGANGVISVTSNVYPVEVEAMTEAALEGDCDSATMLQMKLQPLTELLFCETNPIPVKTAMTLIGYDCGSCRLPLSAMSPVNRRKLEAYLH